MKLVLRLAVSAALSLSVYGAAAGEKKVQLKDLPAAVQKTIQEETRNAEIVGLVEEQQAGKTVYEVETRVNGKTRDVTVDAKGQVIEREEEVALDTLPPAAKAAIEKAASGGTVRKVETVTKGGATSYEASFSKAGKKSEIVVGSDGAIKKH
ncbi:MAG: PepSY domain-containing protein [Burkholderiales bacterium]|jgi:hypothetical protein